MKLLHAFLQSDLSLRFHCMSWSWNPFANKKVMRKKVFLYRFSGMLLLQCDIKNTGIFCSNLASCNAAKFFLVSFFGMRYLEKIFTATSEVCFKANSLNTVWNLTKCYSVTFLDLGRTSSWQGKRLKIHLQCDHFCFLKSPSRKRKCPAFITLCTSLQYPSSKKRASLNVTL